MADRRVTYLPEARADLVRIEARIRDNNGPLVAADKIAVILRKVKLLAINPSTDSKPKRRTLPNGKVLRFAVVMRWWVVYEDIEDENHLVVNAIVDSVRDIPNITFHPSER
ncbi:hypothetical protein D3874_07980 [Oleomonas cavernae]|uniref:Type II toxin-antitoxin system RelE/ParE family toxin n=1 Tax=Oleomonas cavernae TaxID=2320859 RepID=A0A418WAB0_9PROT|nr:type II toxin-antitoxin system RelE/ParE family toxin [Oleomonas cavernae]RJF86963.1 hypothetical protein D3874_07980 [Oleomonas cavernae]